MLLMFRLPVPVLLKVTDCAELVVPTACPANVRLLVESVAMGEPPVAVPVRLMYCGLPAALSEIAIDPVRVPAAVGANLTEIVQLPLGATDALQLFVSEKSPVGTMP